MKSTRQLVFAMTLVLTLCAGSPLAAQQWPELNEAPSVQETGSRDAALIVSIEDYAFLPDVNKANTNAADWERFLSDGLGIPTVLTLTDSQAVREQILLFAERAADAVGEGGTLWFVFIGHGAPGADGKDGVLIGADGQQNIMSIEARGVAQREIQERFRAGKQARAVMLVDACFSGRDRDGESLAVGTMPVLPGKMAALEDDNIVVLTAARGDEVAGNLPELDRPAFSYLVLGGLRGWADDGDGEVTAQEAVTFARRELLGIPGRRQTPQLGGDARMVLSSGANEARPRREAVSDDADAAVTKSKFHLSDPKADGIPDWPVYFSALVGFGTRSTPSDLGLIGVGLAGVKLNALSGKPSEWRIGARFNLMRSTNEDAPSEGSFLTNSATGSLSEVDGNDQIEGAATTVVFAGPQVGYAWRTERVGTGDTVMELDLFGGVGAQLSRCSAWQINTAANEAQCDDSSTSVSPGGGLGFQAQWSILEVGVQAGYVLDLGFIALAGVGLSLDP